HPRLETEPPAPVRRQWRELSVHVCAWSPASVPPARRCTQGAASRGRGEETPPRSSAGRRTATGMPADRILREVPRPSHYRGLRTEDCSENRLARAKSAPSEPRTSVWDGQATTRDETGRPGSGTARSVRRPRGRGRREPAVVWR